MCKQIVVSRNSCPLQIVAFPSRAHVKFGAAAIDVQKHVSPTKGLKNLKGDILKAASAKRIRSNQKNRVSDSDAHFMVCSAGALAVDTLHAEWLFEFQR